MDIWDELQDIWRNHNEEKHVQKLKNYKKDISCQKCYDLTKVRDKAVIQSFRKFWKILEKVITEVESCNGKTIMGFIELVTNEYDDEKEMNTEVKEKAIKTIIYSIRYLMRPSLTCQGIGSIIGYILENCVREENGNIDITDEKWLQEEILISEEIVKFGYMIGDQ